MLTGDICGEAKDVAAFQIAYEKLLEQATEKQSTQKYKVNASDVEFLTKAAKLLNNPAAEEIFEEVNYRQEQVKRIAVCLDLPEDSSVAEIRRAFETNKNSLPTAIANSYEETISELERGEF